MKKLPLVAFLSVLPGLAFAQNIIQQPGAIQDTNARAAITELGDSRWMPQVQGLNVATTNSQFIPVVIPGHLREAWVAVSTAIPVGVPSIQISWAISRNNGSMISVTETANLNTTLKKTLGGVTNVQFPAGNYLLNEGDTLVVGVTTVSGAAGVVNVINRVGF